MLTPATTAPHHITVEEHSALTSSTPADFSSIPPVLRWSSENVAVEVGGEGWYEGKVNGQLWVTEEYVRFFLSHGAVHPAIEVPTHTLDAQYIVRVWEWCSLDKKQV